MQQMVMVMAVEQESGASVARARKTGPPRGRPGVLIDPGGHYPALKSDEA